MNKPSTTQSKKRPNLISKLGRPAPVVNGIVERIQNGIIDGGNAMFMSILPQLLHMVSVGAHIPDSRARPQRTWSRLEKKPMLPSFLTLEDVLLQVPVAHDGKVALKCRLLLRVAPSLQHQVGCGYQQ